MNDEQKIAFIQAQVVCALAAIEGMKAENFDRLAKGEAPAYIESDFGVISEQYIISHNAVIGFFRGGL